MRHTLSGQVLYPFYSLISCTSFNSSSGALGFSFLAINIANKGRLRYQLLRISWLKEYLSTLFLTGVLLCFQIREINQCRFLRLYYNVLRLFRNRNHEQVHFLLLTYPSMLHQKLDLL